jgi:hypothetical protein
MELGSYHTVRYAKLCVIECSALLQRGERGAAKSGANNGLRSTSEQRM